METIMQFLPIVLMQSVFAVFVGQIAARTNKNVPIYVIVALLPIVGNFFHIYVFWSTTLWAIDSINDLKARGGMGNLLVRKAMQ